MFIKYKKYFTFVFFMILVYGFINSLRIEVVRELFDDFKYRAMFLSL